MSHPRRRVELDGGARRLEHTAKGVAGGPPLPDLPARERLLEPRLRDDAPRQRETRVHPGRVLEKRERRLEIMTMQVPESLDRQVPRGQILVPLSHDAARFLRGQLRRDAM